MATISRPSPKRELRLQGTAYDKLDWLIGGFYGKEDIQAQGVMTLGADFQRANSAFNFANLAGVNPLFASSPRWAIAVSPSMPMVPLPSTCSIRKQPPSRYSPTCDQLHRQAEPDAGCALCR